MESLPTSPALGLVRKREIFCICRVDQVQASIMFSVDVIKVIGIKASAASQQSTAIKKPTQRAKGPAY